MTRIKLMVIDSNSITYIIPTMLYTYCDNI